MASYGMNDVKNGMKIIVDSSPCVIVDTDYVKPGKGQAFTRVRYRNIRNGRTVELTMKSTDTVEAADVMDTDMQYLYNDGEFWHFMQPESFEQHTADKNVVGDAAQWIKGEEMCVVTLWNGSPLTVTPPNFVELKIVETDPVCAAILPAAAASRPSSRRCGRARAAVRRAGRNHQGRYPHR